MKIEEAISIKIEDDRIIAMFNMGMVQSLYSEYTNENLAFFKEEIKNIVRKFLANQ